MINPEKLLSGLILGGARRRRGLGSLVTSGVGLGLVGIAMEAAEQFMNKSQKSQTKSPPPGQNPSPPPLKTKSEENPPPPPGAALLPSSSSGTDSDHQDAVLLIRAMVAAANADNIIDKDERKRILGKLKEINLNDEELSFITHELLSPADLNTIIGQVKTPAAAKQVYAISLLAIDIDTGTEKIYINNLRERLKLDDTAVKEVHTKLGVEYSG